MPRCSLNSDTLLAMTTFLGSLFQCPTTISGKSLFPNVQSELPWHSSPERRSTLYSTACLQEALGCDVIPQPSLHQAKQAEGLQLSLTCLALKTFHHLGCFPLDTLWGNVLILRHLKLHTILSQAVSAQRRAAQAPPLTSWWCCASCIPGHSSPFWLPGHTAGSY